MAALVKGVPNLDFSILPQCGGIPWLSIPSDVGKVEDTMSIWDHPPLPELVQQAGVQLKPVGEGGGLAHIPISTAQGEGSAGGCGPQGSGVPPARQKEIQLIG